MPYSIPPTLFAKRFAAASGISTLMQDIASVNSPQSQVYMLGGGNPAHIPEVEAFFQQALAQFTTSTDNYHKGFANYASPLGDEETREILADIFSQETGSRISKHQVIITASSQQSSFLLFNLLAGKTQNDKTKQLLFAQTPEYIGYYDVFLEQNSLTSLASLVEENTDTKRFRYRINHQDLKIQEHTSGICLSRPCNPTGNEATDEELDILQKLASSHSIPLIVDNAYGLPFPGILHQNTTSLSFSEQTILMGSFSKLGLPALRTGFIVAGEHLIEALANMAAIINLAPPSFACRLLLPYLQNGSLQKMCREVIQPHYTQAVRIACELLDRELAGCDYALHEPKGTMFIWLYLPKPKGVDMLLYNKLKEEGVIVLPGRFFFSHQEQNPHPHATQCIRINVGEGTERTLEGLRIVARTIREILA